MPSWEFRPAKPDRAMIPPIRYCKRFRMEVDLRGDFPQDHSTADVGWWPWDDNLLDLHAEAKHLSFHEEMDAVLFPCFTTLDGCRHLMAAIRDRVNFCPEATWLAIGPHGIPVGTIQGIFDVKERYVGAIQNIGVVPEYRGNGIGAGLLRHALAGFRQARVRRVYLEVTAQNSNAIRLYRRFGFRCTKTIYKALEPAIPDQIGVGI